MALEAVEVKQDSAYFCEAHWSLRFAYIALLMLFSYNNVRVRAFAPTYVTQTLNARCKTSFRFQDTFYNERFSGHLPPFLRENNNIGLRHSTVDAKNRSCIRQCQLFMSARSSSTSSTTSNSQRYKNTGGLRELPMVPRGAELLNRAQRAMWKIQPDKSMKNAKARVKKQAAETIDTLMKELCTPMKRSIQGYKRQIRFLHPFEKVVADLTVQTRKKRDGLTLDDVLDDMNEARKEILISGKDWIAKAKDPEITAKETAAIMEEGKERLMEQFKDLAFKPLDGLIEIQKGLRTVPAIQLDTPAVVLVGCPNVGKSSIVRAISSATPEVNNYPFTTRGMTLGHVEVFWNVDGAIENFTIHDTVSKRSRNNSRDDDFVEGTGYAYSQLCQIMDSPGLLVREENDRNAMEELTLAAMRHLPTAVMYVLDLSGEAGEKCSSVEDQLILRQQMRARFPRRPWIDVVAKYDLGVVEGSLEKLQNILDQENSKRPFILLSIKEGKGVEDLQNAVMTMLGEVKVVLDAMAVASAASISEIKSARQ